MLYGLKIEIDSMRKMVEINFDKVMSYLDIK